MSGPGRITRRGLLAGAAAAAGAGAAWWAGLVPGATARPPAWAIAGAIVGASHAAGHRLREGAIPPPTQTARVGVAILGAGISGLSAAWRLAKRGVDDFRLYELEPGPGGTARGAQGPVTAYPWGAHYVPLPTAESVWVRELFEDLGVITGRDADGEPVYDERALCYDPQERVFADGVWQEGLFPRAGASGRDGAEFEAFVRLVRSYRDRRDALGRKAFAIPVEESSRDPELLALDRISMAEFMTRQGWVTRRLRWFVEYGCRDDYGCTLETTSAWAGLHYFASRAEPGRVLTWPEGNGWIVRRLAERIGPRIETGRLVARVIPGDDRVEIDVLDPAANRTTRVTADHAVFALPKHVARHVVEPWRERPPDWLSACTYAPWMVANLAVDRVPEGKGFPPAWDNVLYDSEGLGYVTATHQSLKTAAGPSVLTYYRPFVGADPAAERMRMLQADWAAWRDLILGDLSPAHPGLPAVVRRIDVMLWGHAMIRPVPGFVWGEARPRMREPLGRLHFAHTDLSGLPLFEEAQYWGVRAADAILG